MSKWHCDYVFFVDFVTLESTFNVFLWLPFIFDSLVKSTFVDSIFILCIDIFIYHSWLISHVDCYVPIGLCEWWCVIHNYNVPSHSLMPDSDYFNIFCSYSNNIYIQSFIYIQKLEVGFNWFLRFYYIVLPANKGVKKIV